MDTFSGVIMGLLKKVCPLCAGREGALAPPCPSSRYAPYTRNETPSTR